jgi:hypothetical protein
VYTPSYKLSFDYLSTCALLGDIFAVPNILHAVDGIPEPIFKGISYVQVLLLQLASPLLFGALLLLGVVSRNCSLLVSMISPAPNCFCFLLQASLLASTSLMLAFMLSLTFLSSLLSMTPQGTYRILGFFSSRPNWDPPTTPSPAGECAPPLWFGRGGGGVPVRTTGTLGRPPYPPPLSIHGK